MAFTQADVDRLEKAVVSGTLVVEVEGRKVTYRSMSELLSALEYAKRSLGTVAASTVSLFSYDRG